VSETPSGPIAEQTVAGFLAAVASDAPTPGGGAVAGVAGATGAALIAMVAALTVGKAGYEEVDGRMRELIRESESARAEFLALADADAHAFDGVMAAFKMPKETDAEKAVRSKAIQAGYESAATVPLEIAKRAAELMELARETTEIGNAQAASDGACAGQALASAVWCATYNVEINAAALKDETRRTAMLDEVASLKARADQLLKETQTAFQLRLST
jgi:methenyltetrahydrofolate cyclohydrolase